MAARSRYGFDETRVARFLKEGRGSGTGGDYKPWFTVRDVRSRGRSHRILGRVTGRVHHLLSDLERGAFLIYDFHDCVEDIREQFPLDREETREIAASAAIRHPVDVASRADLVQTSDLVVDLRQDGVPRILARAVKSVSELAKPRVVEKLEIERRYWTARNVDWGIITERELPVTVIRNLTFLQGCSGLDALQQPFPGYYREHARLIAAELKGWRSVSLGEFCAAMDTRFSLDMGSALFLVRNLLAEKVWRAVLSQPIVDTMPMALFHPASAARFKGAQA